jgi:beta-phosphoglucomutase-like phosphatase (HAD superfamily)
MRIHAVILDMDGLMLDTEAMARSVWPCAASDCGYTLPDEVFLTLIGRTSDDSDLILRKHFGHEFPLDEFRRACAARWEQEVAQQGIPVKRCLSDLLDYLKVANIPTGVATSTVRGKAERALKAAGLGSRIRCLATGDEVIHGKPAPDIFLLASKRLGVSPAECLVLEDSPNGIRAAHAAGTLPVLVPDLIQPDSDVARLALKIFPTLCEVRDWLETEMK